MSTSHTSQSGLIVSCFRRRPIQTLFSSLTPENQRTVLQQLLETMKPPRSSTPPGPTTPPPSSSKRRLESPITPSKGKGRKVIEISFIMN